MRVFYALELPDLLRNDIAAFAQSLQTEVHGRYLDPQTYHVTAAFLGNIDAARLPEAKDVLHKTLLASRHKPLHLIPKDLGVFHGSKKSTLYLELEHTTPLMNIAHCLREELTNQEFSYNTKPFLPHITLARNVTLTDGAIFDNGAGLDGSITSSDSSTPSLAPSFPEPGRAQYLTLFASYLTDKGATYEPLYRERLILPTA